MLYIVKSGDNIFEYEKICDEINLRVINSIIQLRGFPLLFSSDMQMLRSYGGTIIYKADFYNKKYLDEYENIYYWLINLEHDQDIDNKFTESKVVNTINNLINSIKRDLTLNEILDI